MNYNHLFHAGNFADVHKHMILVLIINSLLKKSTPFFYLDTHAGSGLYDLKSTDSQRTKEADKGIFQLLKLKNSPEIFQAYLKIIHEYNPNQNIQFYPGSPAIVRSLMRATDRMVLNELRVTTYNTLKQLFHNDCQTSIHRQDSNMVLKALLPPKERRGVVLIDPPYEDIQEIKNLIEGLNEALKRWHTGVYVIWYPIKTQIESQAFYRKLKTLPAKSILMCELKQYRSDTPTLGLNGSGLAIINPPWQLDTQLKTLCNELLNVFNIQQQGSCNISWLKNET